MTRISPLNRFFSLYSKFQHQPRNSPISEFNRLAREYQLKHGSIEEELARDSFNFAMKREFDSIYGSDEKEIDNWHKLCQVLKIDPVPNTVYKCRVVVSKIHVNLVDLIHGSRENIPVFKSEKELSEYTHESKKFFPGEDAEDGGVLRALRRRILEPPESLPNPGKSYYRRTNTVKSIPFGVPTPSRDLGSRPSPRHPRHIHSSSISLSIHHPYTSALLPSVPPSQPHPSGDPA